MKTPLTLTDAANPAPAARIEAEMSLLGALFLGGLPAVESVIDRLGSADFYRSAHGHIWEVMASLCQRGRPIDPVTMADELSRRGVLADCGGMTYLMHLADFTPTVASLGHYLEIVLEQSLRRRIHAVASEIRALSLDEGTTAADVADASIRLIDEATRSRQGMDRSRSMAEVVGSTLARIEDAMRRGGGLAGMATGLSAYDRVVGGYRPGQLHVVAGRSGMGKSVFAATVALNVAEDGGKVAYFTGEMDAEEVTSRLIAATTRTNLRQVLEGRFTATEFGAFCADVSHQLALLPIRFDDSSTITPSQIAARCRRYRRELGGLDLVIVDYIQRCDPDTTRKGGTKAEEIAQIAKALKTLARDFKVPVLALAQPNRNVDHRPDKRPTVADLADSSAIEKEADTVALLYRPSYYERHQDGQPEPEFEESEVILGKNRAGRMTTVKVIFSGPYQRFDDMSDREEDEF